MIKKYYSLLEIQLNNLKRLGGEMIWVGLGQGLAVVGGIIGVRMLTGVLSPTSYGELALGMTFVLLVNQLIMGPISNAALRFFAPAREKHQTHFYFQGLVHLLLLGSVGIAGIGFVLFGLLAFTGMQKWSLLVLLSLTYALLIGLNGILSGVQNAARHRAIVAWHQGIGQWLRFISAIGIVAYVSQSSSGAMFGYVLSALLVMGSQFWFFHKKIISSLGIQNTYIDSSSRVWASEMRQYAWPFASWGIFTWAMLASDRWALQIFESSEIVGLYVPLYQIGYYPTILLAGFLTQLMSPILFSWAGKGHDIDRLKRSWRLNERFVWGMILFTLLISFIAYVFHQQIFSIIVSEEYRKYSGYLPVMILSGGLFASGQIASQTLLVKSASKRLIYPKIGTASIAISMNFLGAYLFGIQGVVYAILAVSVIYFAWIYSLGKIVTKEERRKQRIGNCSRL